MRAALGLAVAAALGFAAGALLFGTHGDCVSETQHLDRHAAALAAEVTLLRQQVRRPG